MTGSGRIYDPDELEKLIETYMEHGDLMGWGGVCTESEEDDPQQEEREDE